MVSHQAPVTAVSGLRGTSGHSSRVIRVEDSPRVRPVSTRAASAAQTVTRNSPRSTFINFTGRDYPP
jgi:hypothetical protein